MNEINVIDFEIECITTSYYTKMARMKFVETPPREDKKAWVESSFDPNKKILSNASISELRSKIIKHRKELIDQLISIITVLTGLTGALIGIAALFLHR